MVLCKAVAILFRPFFTVTTVRRIRLRLDDCLCDGSLIALWECLMAMSILLNGMATGVPGPRMAIRAWYMVGKLRTTLMT